MTLTSFPAPSKTTLLSLLVIAAMTAAALAKTEAAPEQHVPLQSGTSM